MNSFSLHSFFVFFALHNLLFRYRKLGCKTDNGGRIDYGCRKRKRSLQYVWLHAGFMCFIGICIFVSVLVLLFILSFIHCLTVFICPLCCFVLVVVVTIAIGIINAYMRVLCLYMCIYMVCVAVPCCRVQVIGP